MQLTNAIWAEGERKCAQVQSFGGNCENRVGSLKNIEHIDCKI